MTILLEKITTMTILAMTMKVRLTSSPLICEPNYWLSLFPRRRNNGKQGEQQIPGNITNSQVGTQFGLFRNKLCRNKIWNQGCAQEDVSENIAMIISQITITENREPTNSQQNNR